VASDFILAIFSTIGPGIYPSIRSLVRTMPPTKIPIKIQSHLTKFKDLFLHLPWVKYILIVAGKSGKVIETLNSKQPNNRLVFFNGKDYGLLTT
jgi:hypothetical protein